VIDPGKVLEIVEAFNREGRLRMRIFR